MLTQICLAMAVLFTSGARAELGHDLQSPNELAAAHRRIAHDFAHAVSPQLLTTEEIHRILTKYRYLDSDDEVPQDLLAAAVAYFDMNRGSFPNKNFISIVDFTPRSDAYRFFLIDMTTGEVTKYHTTHGQGSDVDNYARKFSNILNSGMSSLGFIRTAEVYDGDFRRSLRLDGLSDTNSEIRDRAVVFHGYDGAHEANVIQGLTLGCIAMDWAVKDGVLDKIKEGSLIYVGLSQ